MLHLLHITCAYPPKDVKLGTILSMVIVVCPVITVSHAGVVVDPVTTSISTILYIKLVELPVTTCSSEINWLL